MVEIIRLEKIWKTYQRGRRQVNALGGVSLPIAAGSFWAVMGPSGSGKSTLLNLLGCLDRATSGCYLLNGVDVLRFSDEELSDLRLRHFGFIFQSFNLIPQLTVRENIDLPLYYSGGDAATTSARVASLAEAVGLAQQLEQRPAELSGGQQQRAAIARALANQPEILLADEPTGNLDSATSRQIMELLQRLNQRGKTIVLVTHDPQIAAYAHRRLFIRDGQIERIEGET